MKSLHNDTLQSVAVMITTSALPAIQGADIHTNKRTAARTFNQST
jgi:hypothetical protein